MSSTAAASILWTSTTKLGCPSLTLPAASTALVVPLVTTGVVRLPTDMLPKTTSWMPRIALSALARSDPKSSPTALEMAASAAIDSSGESVMTYATLTEPAAKETCTLPGEVSAAEAIVFVHALSKAIMRERLLSRDAKSTFATVMDPAMEIVVALVSLVLVMVNLDPVKVLLLTVTVLETLVLLEDVLLKDVILKDVRLLTVLLEMVMVLVFVVMLTVVIVSLVLVLVRLDTPGVLVSLPRVEVSEEESLLLLSVVLVIVMVLINVVVVSLTPVEVSEEESLLLLSVVLVTVMVLISVVVAAVVLDVLVDVSEVVVPDTVAVAVAVVVDTVIDVAVLDVAV
jgi:hypothetical protein